MPWWRDPISLWPRILSTILSDWRSKTVLTSAELSRRYEPSSVAISGSIRRAASFSRALGRGRLSWPTSSLPLPNLMIQSEWPANGLPVIRRTQGVSAVAPPDVRRSVSMLRLGGVWRLSAAGLFSRVLPGWPRGSAGPCGPASGSGRPPPRRRFCFRRSGRRIRRRLLRPLWTVPGN